MKLLATSTHIDEAITDLATSLINDLSGTKPLFVALLRGSVPFTSKLMFEMTKQAPDMHPELDYMMTSTYGDGRKTNQPRIVTDLGPDTEVAGRRVIILDDVLDQGVTSALVASHLTSKGAASVKLAVLVEKDIVRQSMPHADYACFHVGPEWLVGMGLDDASSAKDGYRWLDEIRVVS